MSDLQNKANPIVGFSSALAYEIKELRKEQIITNNLLCALCDKKDEQQDSDNEKHSDWSKAKIKDTRVSLVLLVLANIALYLDVIRVDGKGAFISGLMSWFN